MMERQNNPDKQAIVQAIKRAFGYPTVPAFAVQQLPLQDEMLFISRKRSKNDFVLVRVSDSSGFWLLRYLSIEGQLSECPIRYVHNSYELQMMKRERKLRSEGLYVELEAASISEYNRLERMVRRQVRKVFLSRCRLQ